MARSQTLSSNPTLSFTSTNGFVNNVATDGTGGSTAITDFDIQILPINSSGAKLTTYPIEYHDGSQPNWPGYPAILTYGQDVEHFGWSVRSANGAEFSFKGVDFLDWGDFGDEFGDGYIFVVEAFRDGSSLGTVNFVGNTTTSYAQVREGAPLTGIFKNVDEVRIYRQGGIISWGTLNNVRVGTAIATPATPTASSNSPVCAGNTINLSTPTVAGATYTWSGPNGFLSTVQNPTITNVTAVMAGTYNVTVTVSGATSAAGTATVVVNTLTSAVQSQSNVSTYGGNNGSATLSVSGGTAPYFYSWSPSGGTAATGYNLSAGTYTVTITDSTPGGGCTKTQTVTITQPGGSIVSTTALNAFSTCANSASTPQSFTISAGGLTANLLVSAPTGYEISTSAGGSYSNNISFVPSGGSVSTYTIYARLASTASGTPSGNITISSTGIPNKNVAVTGTVNIAPSITAQPSNSSVCAGGITTFSVTASNATGYQWQVDQGAGFSSITNGGVYSNATTATLTITGATAAMNGYLYRLIATGTCTPSAASNNVALTVNAAPAITAQPSGSIICAGANTTFSATASNATGYQWQVDQGAGFSSITNGGVYSNATTATLTITGATAAMNGYLYRLIATGTCTPSAASNNVALTVNAAPAITAQPSGSIICAGANTTFSATASNATGYQWQVDQGAGFSSITNGGVYSNATTATLTITGAAAAMNGYLYRLIATGTCTPLAVSNNAALTVNVAPAITAQPSNSMIIAGNNTTFSATASGATGYQWQVDEGAGFNAISNGGVYSNATTATLTITGATVEMSGFLYRLVVNGTCIPAAYSNNAVLTVSSNPLPVTIAKYLEVKKQNDGIQLSWATASETNNKGFDIYRSGNGKQFDILKTINGKVNSNVIQYYNHLDNSPLKGWNYYRLVQVDLDGKETIIGEKAVDYQIANAALSVYPNPTAGKITVDFEANKYQKAQLISIHGKLLMEQSIASGNAQCNFDIANLPSGTYILQLSGNAGVLHTRVIRK
ncbi:T9SS type A sorting domain-containing protein [Pedobacter ureilyticus]|uniref:T9SS type A sorting domain-containing protein n=1 Tax=Pedobacter ureilyticus TaxID=1393051 RepID=A0ABW9J6N4_9SPHI